MPTTTATAVPRMNKVAILVTMSCSIAGVLMQALDTTIANVALPYMQGSLSASRDQISWVLTSYIVASAIMTAPVGWLANRFGTKIVFILALAGFTIASVICGMALTLDEMVLFRAMQGVFGAALTPLSLAILLALFPPEKRAQPMSIWGMGIMLGPILGPTLGGLLTEYYSWRWCFYVNVPFGILAIGGLWFSFRETKIKIMQEFDWLGFGVLALAVGGFQLMLDRGTGQDWFTSNEIVIDAVLACLGIYLFFAHMMLTKRAPLFPRKLFVDRNLVISVFMMYIVNAILLASLSMMPAFLQSVAGRPVLNSGLLLAPRGFGVIVAMILAGKFGSSVDPRRMMTTGMAILAWTLWKMAHWPSYIGGEDFLFITIVQGFGMGLVFGPLSVISFATLTGPLHNDGTTLISLIRNIGSAAGISAATAILSNGIQTIHEQLAAQVTPFDQVLSINAISKLANFHLPSGAARLDGLVAQMVAPLAYGNVYLSLFYLSVASLPLIWLYKRPAYSVAERSKAAALQEAPHAAE